MSAAVIAGLVVVQGAQLLNANKRLTKPLEHLGIALSTLALFQKTNSPAMMGGYNALNYAAWIVRKMEIKPLEAGARLLNAFSPLAVLAFVIHDSLPSIVPNTFFIPTF